MYHSWYKNGKCGEQVICFRWPPSDRQSRTGSRSSRPRLSGSEVERREQQVATPVRAVCAAKKGKNLAQWAQEQVVRAWSRLRICADLPHSGNGRRSLTVRENLSPIIGMLASIRRGLVGGASSTRICHTDSVTYGKAWIASIREHPPDPRHPRSMNI